MTHHFRLSLTCVWSAFLVSSLSLVLLGIIYPYLSLNLASFLYYIMSENFLGYPVSLTTVDYVITALSLELWP